MHPEQAQAVEKTIAYFKSYRAENPDKTPHLMKVNLNQNVTCV